MGSTPKCETPMEPLSFGRMVSGISETASAASQEASLEDSLSHIDVGINGVSIRFPSTSSKRGVTFDAVTSPTTPCAPSLGVNKVSRKLSRQQSILRVPSCAGLGGKIMEDLKRSASSKASGLSQRRNSRLPTLLSTKTSAEYEKEIEDLESQLEDASAQLLKACEVGQGLVQELEQTRTELTQVEESEMLYYDKMTELEDAFNKLQEVYKRSQSEIVSLKVANAAAIEEADCLKQDVLRQESFNRRKEEQSLIDRIENDQWISANLVTNNAVSELQVTQSKCEEEEHVARDSVSEIYFNALFGIFKEMHSSITVLYDSTLQGSLAQLCELTSLKETQVIQSARIESLEASAASRNAEIEQLRGSLCAKEATVKNTNREVNRNNKNYNIMIKNASKLVSELREVCSVTKKSLNDSTSTRGSPGSPASPSGSAFSS
eukprot:TRINITY_DN16574_c0_g1_i1.p1 TRINITY_DN16574_c0_g1~~TRINITY_DN16574_c0_g1_i1.p1  ORF type:complete len:435 (+),score=93.04 TRINITY_DN16574_c0_g1_i1:39-1343(+)